VRYWYSKSVCLSVQNARNVLVWDENGLTYLHSFFTIRLPNHSSFTSIKHLHGIPWWGIKISRFSTNKSLYLANDARYRHSYYGRRIGTRIQSIKWCHFQWPWMDPDAVFKVTPLFDAKYLTNGYRYGHSYYRRRIGNHTQAFKCYHFQWPSVTSNPHFKVTIVFNVK